MENEKRLIDANALKQRFDEREADDIEMYGCHIRECFPADDAKEIVDQMPTVEAVEVVHAEWVVEAYTADDSIVVIPYKKSQHNDPFCSRCGHHALLNCGEYVTSNYCPNCGAKMDGGNEDG